MERITKLERAREIMGSNLMDVELISIYQRQLGLMVSNEQLEKQQLVPYSEKYLIENAQNCFLVWGIPLFKDGTPLNLLKMREHFKMSPTNYEPCFYSQDWYEKEAFVNEYKLENKWYIVRKEILDDTRAQSVNRIKEHGKLLSALELAYAFFSYYIFSNGKKLWENDYVWTSDLDHQGDPIYVGRYADPNKKNKNGFSIHRHLMIRSNYGSI